MLPSIVPLKRKISCSTTAKFSAQRFQIPLAQVHAVQQNPAALHIVKAHQQIRNRRLAGTGVAHQRNRLTGLDLERNVLENPVFIFVSKPNIFKFDVTPGAARLQRLSRAS